MPRFGVGQKEAENETGRQAAEMRRHAHSGSEKVEGDLHEHDQPDIAQPKFGEIKMTLPEKNPRPRAHDSHDATGSADQFAAGKKMPLYQEHDTETRSETRKQVAGSERDRAEFPFERGTEQVKSEEIKEKMDRTVMEKERAQQSPVLMAIKNEVGVQLSQALESGFIFGAAGENFQEEHENVRD